MCVCVHAQSKDASQFQCTAAHRLNALQLRAEAQQGRLSCGALDEPVLQIKLTGDGLISTQLAIQAAL